MLEQDNLKIAKETLTAVNAHDLDGFVSYLDESHVWEHVSCADTEDQLWDRRARAIIRNAVR